MPLLGLSVFGSGVLAQPLRQRICLLRLATGVLLGVFTGVGVGGLVVAFRPLSVVSSLWQLAHIGLSYPASSTAYIIIYKASRRPARPWRSCAPCIGPGYGG